MMKQKLSPVKYETAFVPPNYIYFRQKKKTIISWTLYYLSYWGNFWPYHNPEFKGNRLNRNGSEN